MEEQQIIDETGTKKIRHRKKLLYNSIRQQMEFYFGDSNLSKDRYLSQLITTDPYIDISVFLKFNRIRNLTDKIDDICKALRKSQILELSEDNTKVCRKIPIKYKENEDECTVYVERLPVDTEHDWLKTVFSKFGTIDYVSIPRYKHNRMIKGFAFIEFSLPESAKKVLEYFESIGCKLPTSMLPDQLASISAFDDSTKDVLNKCSTETVQIDEPSESETKVETIDTEPANKKIKTTDDDVTETSENLDVEKPSKKRTASDADDNSDVDKKKKKLDTEVTEVVPEGQEIQEDDIGGEETSEKRKRRRKKTRKSHSLDLQQIGLQVLSKKEWKQLRNKYLNLQRQKMKTLKEQLNRGRFAKFSADENTTTDKKHSKSEKESEPRFKYEPGTIVQVTLTDVCNDVKKLKSEIRVNAGCEYVDMPLGGDTGFVRFSSGENARKFCESPFNASMQILEGQAEKDYWEKILENRENKFKKDVGKKQRGRDKLLRKAEKELGKHIKFDAE